MTDELVLAWWAELLREQPEANQKNLVVGGGPAHACQETSEVVSWVRALDREVGVVKGKDEVALFGELGVLGPLVFEQVPLVEEGKEVVEEVVTHVLCDERPL